MGQPQETLDPQLHVLQKAMETRKQTYTCRENKTVHDSHRSLLGHMHPWLNQ